MSSFRTKKQWQTGRQRLCLLGLAVMIALSLVLVQTASAYAQCGGDVEIGDTVTGKISYRACDYYFYGKSGQRVTITMRSTSLDPYLNLYLPYQRDFNDDGYYDDDDYWLKDDDGYGTRTNDAKIEARLPSNGWYRIKATSYSGTDKGRFRLSVTSGYSYSFSRR